MITIYKRTHLRWEGPVSLSYFEFFMDSVSDLPSDVYYFSSENDKYKIAQGSLAYDISTSGMYMMDSTGTWVQQGG